MSVCAEIAVHACFQKCFHVALFARCKRFVFVFADLPAITRTTVHGVHSASSIYIHVYVYVYFSISI